MPFSGADQHHPLIPFRLLCAIKALCYRSTRSLGFTATGLSHSYKSWFNQVGCYDGCDSRLRVSTMSRYSLFTRPPVSWMHQALMEHLPFQVSSRTSDPEDCQRLPDRCQLFSMFLLHCEEIALLSDELVKHTNSTPISTIYSRPVCLQTGSGLCDAGCT